MSGFIDPESHTRDMLYRLDLTVDLLLRNLTEDALSPESRRLLAGVRLGDPAAINRMRQLMDKDPLDSDTTEGTR